MRVQIALRKFWLTTSLCMLTVVNLPAQESYFPHHAGDMWEYYVIGDNLFEIMQVIVVSDSVGQDSFSYFQHYRQFINPPRPTSIPWWENFRQDTSANIFASGLGYSNRLMYKLNAPKKNLWIVTDLGGGCYDIARVEDIYPDTLFGIPTTVKGIAYYSTCDTTDSTVWLQQYGELLADGFGTIFRGGGDLAIYYEMFLKGAVIDSVGYGDTTLVGIKQQIARILPHQFYLLQNYPNPFNPNTTIRFGLPEDGNVSLKIYAITGEEIITLKSGYMEKGYHELKWNGRNKAGGEVASGMYFYVLKAGDQILTKKMLLMR